MIHLKIVIDFMGPIHQTWVTLLDIIGPRAQWPRYMPRLFWKGNPLTNEERFKVTLFVFINGVPPFLIKRWYTLLNLVDTPKRWAHIDWLWATFEKGQSRPDEFIYHMWNVAMGVEMWVNGETYYYGRFAYLNPQ